MTQLSLIRATIIDTYLRLSRRP